MPSLVAREALLLALAIPLVRRIVSAFSKSPPASVRARLQSIIPAFVFSRSFFTICGSISVVVFIPSENLINRPSGGDAGHFQLLANSRFATGGNDRID